jgi:predicted GIY-YIG superfamily endonuclease
MVHVYELRNVDDIVVYVGETTRPKRRLKEHIQYKPASQFYGMNLTMNIVSEFGNKQDAFAFQCALQNNYGFETDKEKAIRNAIKGGQAIMASGNHNFLKNNRTF